MCKSMPLVFLLMPLVDEINNISQYLYIKNNQTFNYWMISILSYTPNIKNRFMLFAEYSYFKVYFIITVSH